MKDTINQIKEGTAQMSIVTDMITRLRELKAKLKKSEKGSHSVTPNAPAPNHQPLNRPGPPKPSASTNDSSAGTIVIK